MPVSHGEVGSTYSCTMHSRPRLAVLQVSVHHRFVMEPLASAYASRSCVCLQGSSGICTTLCWHKLCACLYAGKEGTGEAAT